VQNPKKKNKTAEKNHLALGVKATIPVFTTAIIFSFFINLLMFVSPLYMLQIYDRVLSSRSETTLIGISILAATLIGVYAILEMLRSRVLVRAGVLFDRNIADPTFEAIHKGRMKRPSAGHEQCLRDVDTLRGFLTGSGLIALCDAPWFPVFVAGAFILHPWYGYLVLGGSVVMLLLTLLNEMMTRKTLGAATLQASNANQSAQATFRNGEVMQAMGMLGPLRAKWSKEHNAALALQATASDSAGSILATTKFFTMLMQIAVLGIGAYLAIQNEISPGAIIAGSILMGRAMQPIQQAVANWKGFISARGAYQRIKNLYAEIGVEEPRMKLPPPAGNLSLENVIAAPPGTNKPIIKGMTFALQAGEVLGVVGPNAAGKSSLARILVGVWPVAGGSVRLDGSDLAHWDPAQLGPHLGYLPQDVELFSGTVAENIARQITAPDGTVDEPSVIAAAQLAGCYDMIQQLPEGFNTEIGDGGSVLSGGQRQRIGLARALFGQPALVVLDEPNASLDTTGEAALVEAVKSFKTQSTTCVIITHKMNLLGVCDKILLMNAGTLQAFGDRDKVLAELSGPRVVTSEDPPSVNSAARPSIPN